MRRTVVFDFGGVLFRWQPSRLIMETLPHLARDPAAAQDLAGRIFQSFAPESDWAMFDRGLSEPDVVAARIGQRLGLPVQDLAALIAAIPAHLQVQPAAVALLQEVRAAGHRVVYLSNMPRPFADYLEQHHAFLADFEDGLFSGRVGLVKPMPAIYERAARRFGAAGETLFIDDHAVNLDAATQAVGWQGLCYTDAEPARSALRERGWL
jgi:putative hydrolase of the HAD superfamily